ncbi:hypothetical protein AEST_09030 [Alishewanella aestuarii B11]|uniref:Uncharacterized protein n=1 Tax=Alishewanella aestuarii B11 TaxID=1197174 RepID=J1Q550_9ALTE|nr:hypothetical protein [Alishewanella aestuarii]EJI86273.1 hypothetical protein AEST_09030 [Alishewanella aestuarii B11]
MRHPTIFAILFFLTFAVRAECDSFLANGLNSDLKLSYEKFDQTPGKGWRVLADKKCYSEAAILIDKYILENNVNQRSLKWHLLQMYAASNQNDKALNLVSAVLLTEEQERNSPFLWNDYVLATAGFLENDLTKLKLHRDKLANFGKGFKPNEINLVALDRLIENFGQTYQKAYIGD